MTRKKLVILGSTGSIGTQTLEVASSFPNKFDIVALAANKNAELISKQILSWAPKFVALTNEKAANDVRAQGLDVSVLSGDGCLVELIEQCGADMAVVAVSGVAGIEATFAALKTGMDVALANKETLVSAGRLVMDYAKRHGRSIYPVDSEHSAIWQCLVGEDFSAVSKIILTASGGPFLHHTREELLSVSVKEALAHPTWSMGSKISIDSATLMNKGLEVVEAAVLFGLESKCIDVVIHPQSIIHSMVEFHDGALKAQLGVPSMKEPIQYALFGGKRKRNELDRLFLSEIGTLTFQKPDYQAFPCLQLAFDALVAGGTMTAVLNMANEVAVKMFLQEKIRFLKIADIVAKTMCKHTVISEPNLDEILAAQQWAFRTATDLCRI